MEELRKHFSFHMQGCGNLLLSGEGKVSKAREEIKIALQYLNQIRLAFPSTVTSQRFKDDIIEAFTMFFKVLETKKEDSLEVEAEMVAYALELCDHEDLKEGRTEVMKGLISLIVKSYDKSDNQNQRILCLVSLISSLHAQSLILIEVNNQTELFRGLPVLPQRQEMTFMETEELVSLIRQSRDQSHLLLWLLNTPWTFHTPLQMEDILSKCLLICSENDDLYNNAMVVMSRYVKLIVSERDVDWRCCTVVLGLGEKIRLEFTEKISREDTEEWLSCLQIISVVLGDTSHYLSYTEQLLDNLIQQGKLSQMKTSLATLRTEPSLFIWKAFILSEVSENWCEAGRRLDEITRIEHFKTGDEVREWLGSLLLLLTDERRLVSREALVQLLASLADAGFHWNLFLLEFGLMLSLRLESVDQLAWRILTDAQKWDLLEGSKTRTADLCRNLCLSSSSPFTRLSLTRLEGIMLSQRDPRKDVAFLNSVNAGVSALNGSQEEVKEYLVPLISEMFDYLDQQLKDASMRRTFLLLRLKFLVASSGRYHWNCSQLLTEFKLREDTCGLVQTSKIVFESRLPSLADLAVSALIEAIKLEKDEREREKLSAGALEMVSVLSENVTSSTLELTSLITSFAWKDRALLGESIKISWNTWIKVTSCPVQVSRFWYSILASLHNTAVSQREDEIARDSVEPTAGLLRRVRKTVEHLSVKKIQT